LLLLFLLFLLSSGCICSVAAAKNPVKSGFNSLV
jgi:hypothetical protein